MIMTTAVAEAEQCGVPGCRQPRRARGLCGMHYHRWRRTGDVGEAGSTYGQTGCSVPGCARPHRARGWCAVHYDQHQRPHGQDAAGCARPDCARSVYARRLCTNHYQQLRRVLDDLGLLEDTPGPRQRRREADQAALLQLLAAGATLTDAAEQLGRGLTLVHRWRKQDPDFDRAVTGLLHQGRPPRRTRRWPPAPPTGADAAAGAETGGDAGAERVRQHLAAVAEATAARQAARTALRQAQTDWHAALCAAAAAGARSVDIAEHAGVSATRVVQIVAQNRR
jgi:hypothetical protein